MQQAEGNPLSRSEVVLTHFSWLDVLAAVVLAFSTFAAAVKGFTAEVLALAGMLLGLILAFLLYPPLALGLTRAGMPASLASLASFLGIFLSVLILSSSVGVLAGRFFRKIYLGWLDRLLGAGFGLIRGALIVAVVFLAFAVFPVSGEPLSASRLAPWVLQGSRALVLLAPEGFRSRFEERRQDLHRLWIQNTQWAHEPVESTTDD